MPSQDPLRCGRAQSYDPWQYFRVMKEPPDANGDDMESGQVRSESSRIVFEPDAKLTWSETAHAFRCFGLFAFCLTSG